MLSSMTVQALLCVRWIAHRREELMPRLQKSCLSTTMATRICDYAFVPKSFTWINSRSTLLWCRWLAQKWLISSFVSDGYLPSPLLLFPFLPPQHTWRSITVMSIRLTHWIEIVALLTLLQIDSMAHLSCFQVLLMWIKPPYLFAPLMVSSVQFCSVLFNMTCRHGVVYDVWW